MAGARNTQQVDPTRRHARRPADRPEKRGWGRVKILAPLEGIRIVEWLSDECSIAIGLAISFAGRVAADLGATVLQVDAPLLRARRAVGPLVDGESALARFIDRDKQQASAAAVMKGGTADVIICDVAHAMASDHVGTASLVIVSDRAQRPGVPDSEFTLLAVGGLLDLVGDPTAAPLRLGGHQLAYSAGLAVYAGIAGELCRRQGDGVPDTLRVNIADVAVWLNWKSVAMGSWSARVPSRLGDGAEWRTIRCADGWLALVYLEADWPKLKLLVGDPRLDEPRYEDRLERRRDATRINAVVEQAFATKTRAELRDVALARRIPLGPVWTPAELEHDQQYVARGFLQRSADRDGASVLRPLPPVIWNGTRFGSGASAEIGA
jgi:crotonobetainyl-CoA:carnitine CoA-transferase CaiB-like acyl-CoA transferase